MQSMNDIKLALEKFDLQLKYVNILSCALQIFLNFVIIGQIR